MKNAERGSSVPTGIAVGSSISVACMLLGTLITALLVNGNRMTLGGADYAVAIVTVASCAFGSVVSAKLVGRNKLPVGLGSGAVCFLVLIGITALIFEGQYQDVWITALLIGIGCMSPLLVNLREKNGSRRWRRKRLNR
jgi:putative membrane protein (TIGR04086 family)